MTEYRTIDAPGYQSQMCFNGDWSFCIGVRNQTCSSAPCRGWSWVSIGGTWDD